MSYLQICVFFSLFYYCTCNKCHSTRNLEQNKSIKHWDDKDECWENWEEFQKDKKQCKKSIGNLFHRGSDFMTVAKTDAFVDKSMFIKEIFDAGTRLLITAPKRFGKSTNLNMLKTFLSKNSYKRSTVKNAFMKLRINERYSCLFSEHYGRYSVVSVDFKAKFTKRDKYSHALRAYKQTIHQAYLEHQYLETSKKLSKENRMLCKLWCGKKSVRKMTEVDVMSGLESLIRMLKKHNLNRKSVVLIDQYDSVIGEALLKVNNNSDLNNIVSLTSHILSTLIQHTEDAVQLVVVTGVSYISSMGLSELNNLKRYYFLDDHPFAKFYGLTEDDVTSLNNISQFISFSQKRELMKQTYNGYISKGGIHIYNTYSVFKYLERGLMIKNPDKSDYFSNVIEMIRFKEVATMLDSLLINKSVKLNVQYKIDWIDVIKLRKAYIQGDETMRIDKDLILTHFLEIGLLTYDKIINDNQVKVKLPNRQVHEIIFHHLKIYLSRKCNLPKIRTKSYSLLKGKLYNHYKSARGYCKRLIGYFMKKTRRLSG